MRELKRHVITLRSPSFYFYETSNFFNSSHGIIAIDGSPLAFVINKGIPSPFISFIVLTET